MRRTSLQGMRILIADDEEMIREVVSELLTPRGCEVTEAASGNEAFRTLQQGQEFDVLLTDVRMPDGDGLELIQRIYDELPQCRPDIIVCSGFSDVTTEMVRDLRITRILQKPFTMDELVEILLKLG